MGERFISLKNHQFANVLLNYSPGFSGMMDAETQVSAQKSTKTNEELSLKAEEVIKKMIDKYLVKKKENKKHPKK